MSVNALLPDVVAEEEPHVTATFPGDMLIDARGLYSPEPLQRLIAAIGRGQRDDIFEMLTSDRRSRAAVLDWVAQAHHQLLSMTPDDGYTRFVVRKTH
jgi:tRNA 2-thiouridine synthesizing protein A